MKSLAIIIVCMLLIASGIWGISDPSSSVQWLLATNADLNFLRYAMAVLLSCLALAVEVPTGRIARPLLKGLGAAFLSLTILWMIAPTTLGLEAYTMLPLDLVLLLLGGIFSLTTALEAELLEEATLEYNNLQFQEPQYTSYEKPVYSTQVSGFSTTTNRT